MQSLHILDTINRLNNGVDQYEGQFHEEGVFDNIDEKLFPPHTRLG